KKYANRRLYDTAASKYITLEDLAERIRRGSDVVSVQDAHTGTDITQATLTQIILESRGGAKLLPVPLLMRLIRMEDESLAEVVARLREEIDALKRSIGKPARRRPAKRRRG